MKLVVNLQMYNEVVLGNLERCLENVKQYADEIVIYDDASTDNSIEVASEYTDHIIHGEVHNVCQELAHKQLMLDYSMKLGADWVFWIDADEILDRNGTLGGAP